MENKIYAKLLEFQKQDIKVSKVGDNPHFKSSYATINEVLDKVKAPLNKLGILIIQKPQADGLQTVLLDTEDGSSIECFMPYVEATTAQKLGSNNTYNRRYSLITLLGLEDEDDDGNVASAPSKSPLKVAQEKMDKAQSAEELRKIYAESNLSEEALPVLGSYAQGIMEKKGWTDDTK